MRELAGNTDPWNSISLVTTSRQITLHHPLPLPHSYKLASLILGRTNRETHNRLFVLPQAKIHFCPKRNVVYRIMLSDYVNFLYANFNLIATYLYTSCNGKLSKNSISSKTVHGKLLLLFETHITTMLFVIYVILFVYLSIFLIHIIN